MTRGHPICWSSTSTHIILIYLQITLPVCWWARSPGAVRIGLSARVEVTPPEGLVATGSDLDR